MRQTYKRIFTGIMALVITMSNFTALESKAASGGNPGGSGELEGVLSDVFSVVVPTEADRPAIENTLYKNAFDFILDPKGLASAASGSLAGKNLEPGATVYFENVEPGSPYEFSSTSDGFTVINKGMVDVDVTLEGSLTGMDGVRLTSDKNFVDDKSASVYLALTDSRGKVSAVDKFGAAVKTTLKGRPNAYKAIYNFSSGKYEYQMKSDAELQKDNIKFADYTFRLTGACNSSNSWMKLSGYLEPEINVTWRVALRPKQLAPSVLKTSYVMNNGKAVFVEVDLGEGALAATGIKAITYTNASGVTNTLAAANYIFEDGTLRFRAAYISNVLNEGVKSRNYTVVFNDSAGTKEILTLVANDDIAPSLAQTEYEMINGQPVMIDMDLGAGILGATGIKSITFVNPQGKTASVLSDKYTFENGALTFSAAYIDKILGEGVASREYIITLNDKAETRMKVILKAKGTKPSVAQARYEMEKGKDVEVNVDLGSETLAATGISSITFVNALGNTKEVMADKYTFANGVLTFTSAFIDKILGEGVTSRVYTLNFDDAAKTKIEVTLTAKDEMPSNTDAEYFITGSTPVMVNVDLGSGESGATGIKSITFVNPQGKVATVMTDKYTFVDGVLTFSAAYIDKILGEGVTSREYVITLNNKAESQIKVTFTAKGTKPSVAQASYQMENGKDTEVNVDLGSETLAATGISSITFVNALGNTKEVMTDKYTFANGVLTFNASFIDKILGEGVTSRTYTLHFNDAGKTQAKVTLTAPNTAPSIDIKEYTMVSGKALEIKVDLGSGSLRATGIKSVTYVEGSSTKTVPTSYYVFENGVFRFRAAYINGVIDGKITSRDYKITFNDNAATSVTVKLQK